MSNHQLPEEEPSLLARVISAIIGTAVSAAVVLFLIFVVLPVVGVMVLIILGVALGVIVAGAVAALVLRWRWRKALGERFGRSDSEDDDEPARPYRSGPRGPRKHVDVHVREDRPDDGPA